jgi:hypothetical protein
MAMPRARAGFHGRLVGGLVIGQDEPFQSGGRLVVAGFQTVEAVHHLHGGHDCLLGAPGSVALLDRDLGEIQRRLLSAGRFDGPDCGAHGIAEGLIAILFFLAQADQKHAFAGNAGRCRQQQRRPRLAGHVTALQGLRQVTASVAWSRRLAAALSLRFSKTPTTTQALRCFSGLLRFMLNSTAKLLSRHIH